MLRNILEIFVYLIYSLHYPYTTYTILFKCIGIFGNMIIMDKYIDIGMYIFIH